MSLILSLLVLLLADILFLIKSDDLAVIVPPLPINVTLATQSFTSECVAQSADNLFFLVNGTLANEGLEDFSEGVLITNGNTKTRILTVTVSLNISNSNISCRAFKSFPLAEVTSEPALILVQGALDPPMITNTSIIDNTAVYISWAPPPTLEGTVINGYYVTSTTGDSAYTEDDSVALSITNPDPCGINISILAYNGINGTAAEVDNIILPSIPNEVVPVSAIIFNQSQEIVDVIIRVNVSELCLGEYPESVLININNSIGFSVFFSILNLAPSFLSNYIDSSTKISLPIAYQSYYITVILMNILGNFESSIIFLSFITTQILTVVSPTITSTVPSVVSSSFIMVNTTTTESLSSGSIGGIIAGVICVIAFVLGGSFTLLIVIILYRKKVRLETESTDDIVVSLEPNKDEDSSYNFIRMNTLPNFPVYNSHNPLVAAASNQLSNKENYDHDDEHGVKDEIEDEDIDGDEDEFIAALQENQPFLSKSIQRTKIKKSCHTYPNSKQDKRGNQEDMCDYTVASLQEINKNAADNSQLVKPQSPVMH